MVIIIAVLEYIYKGALALSILSATRRRRRIS
jgi:hypothetical protein